MKERLEHCSGLHVRPYQHLPGVPAGHPVGPLDRRRVSDRPHPEAAPLEQTCYGASETRRSLTGQQPGRVHLRNGTSRGLVDREHPLHPEPGHHLAGLDGLSLPRGLALPQQPGATAGLDSQPLPDPARRQDRISVLAPLHAAPQVPPRDEPGHISRIRGSHRPCPERLLMGVSDEQHVARAVGMQPRLETQEPLPVLPRHQRRHLRRQQLLRRRQTLRRQPPALLLRHPTRHDHLPSAATCGSPRRAGSVRAIPWGHARTPDVPICARELSNYRVVLRVVLRSGGT